VLAQDVLIHARLVVKPLQVRNRAEAQQVAVARLVFRQQQQVVAGLVLFGFVADGARRKVDFAADDGLDSCSAWQAL
jgi:ribosomal protein L35AE/L33A